MKTANAIKKITAAKVKAVVDTNWSKLSDAVSTHIENEAKKGESSTSHNLTSIYPSYASLGEDIKNKLAKKLATALRKKGYSVPNSSWHSFEITW